MRPVVGMSWNLKLHQKLPEESYLKRASEIAIRASEIADQKQGVCRFGGEAESGAESFFPYRSEYRTSS